MYDLILASASPRRKDLLQKEGYTFVVHTVKVSENIKENLNSSAAIEDISRRKASAFLQQYKRLNLVGKLVLTADTMVMHQGRLLGKPKDHREAASFLRSLSGSTHSVVTAMSLVADGDLTSLTSRWVETKVEFRNLVESEIQEYIATGDPMDKAGGYGIQGSAGQFVSGYQGSWSNVVGLPVEEFSVWLKELNYHVN